MHLVVLGLAIIALIFGPGLWVQRVLKRYSRPANRYSDTGGELARYLLDECGLQSVKTEATDKGDHYDPEAKVVRLTKDKFEGRSLTAVTVAAHEVGHALQDAAGYRPLKLRTRLVRLAAPGERLAALAMMLSPFISAMTRAPLAGLAMFFAGIAVMGLGTLIHLVTLPTELDASFGRALPLLKKRGILLAEDELHARKLLTAAAWTYVAGSLMSLLNVARWWAILRR
ncbi:MAG: zinc metallopeptidase [Pseudomonadota bacterium]|nr:zinc metallopeptidase [Pseudomonadota bacterium]